MWEERVLAFESIFDIPNVTSQMEAALSLTPHGKLKETSMSGNIPSGGNID